MLIRGLRAHLCSGVSSLKDNGEDIDGFPRDT